MGSGDKKKKKKKKKRRREEEDVMGFAKPKAEENIAERRKRRLEKKQEKLLRQKKREESYFGYTNQNNPFGDDSLTELFIWKKKYEQEGVSSQNLKKVVQTHLKKKQSELGREIEKTRERRIQRQREQETLETLQAELAREREIEANIGWAEKEELFHKEQCIIRSKMRIKEGRERPVDKIAKNIHKFFAIRYEKASKKDNSGTNPLVLAAAGNEDDVDYGVSYEDPVQVVQKLGMNACEDILTEIEEFLQLEEENELWHMVLIIARERKAQLDRLRQGQDLRQSGISNVSNEVESMFKGKSYKELCECEEECKQMLSGDINDIAIDEEYWQAVLNMCTLFKSKARLREVNFKVLQQYEALREAHAPRVKQNEIQKALQEAEMKSKTVYMDDTDDMFITKLSKEFKKLWNRAVTPEQDHLDLTRRRRERLKEELKMIAEDPRLQDPLKHSNALLQSTLTSKKDRVDISAADEELLAKVRNSKAMQSGEMADLPLKMTVDIPAQAKRSYLWHEKYRPRKPKYFNKVKTGYSWNKYNQTHYDYDNPPPKIVQGYKFNIFYPDLIDPTRTPTYKVYEQVGSEYATVVFHAGPPYEDIAFKVVNNDWECNHKRGFRCRFEKGIFSLYFNFRRHRYRR